MKLTAHSEKALKTFDMMNTKPADWGLTPIKWVQEMHSVPTKVKCSTCHGIGQAYFRADGQLWVNKVDYDKNYYGWNDEQRRMRAEGKRDRCPTCPPRRGHPSYGTGEVVEIRKRKVWVGYVQWEKGTKFDSRFALHDRTNCRVCELCSKSIFGKMSGLVPVHGKGADGTIHGMWVGEDCARKFLGIKKFPKDHFVQGGSK